jgi:CMP-N-acetylneuraminic acid synthetase
MKLLALIPARGGSKGVPRKNIRKLRGKPLLAWTIEAAHASPSIDRIVVSTEDEEIAEVAGAYGADVPFLRPQTLAQDDTPGMDPVLHALGELPEYDWILLLQPTSPLRTAADIEGIVKFCHAHGAPSVVSICEVNKHPYWMYYCDAGHQLQPLIDKPLIPRRQDLPPVYVLNGALYLARRDWLIAEKNFIGEGAIGYQMPMERSADIDTIADWEWVEFLLERQNAK